jgi:cellulose synthase (UDP-forming)
MSRSTLIAHRLASRAIFRKTAGVFIIVTMLVYLLWRLTIFSDNWLFSLAFYMSELLSFLLVVAMISSAWNYRHREPKKPQDGEKVDVFLPVYKEPLEMIRQTVRAAQRMRYPHTTYVLDDGKRDEIKLLAEEFGAVYIRRANNQGAKAGNMNHALDHARGDFIFVFDADHIAQPEAIDAVLGFFKDGKVGQVITPQDYYNLDGLQFMHHGKGRIWHDQSRFYNVTQGCKDHFNSATSCGTGVMYRRKAIDEVGGFPELTITEDMHVSLLMHEAGYGSVYLNEAIAYGVAPADLADYYRTRERWAHGNLHVLKAEKPWKSKRLTLKQRLSYMELGVIYLECWQQLLLFLVPVLSIFFAWQPFQITPLNVMIVLTLPLVMVVLHDEQGCGMSRNWKSQLFAIARMPVQIAAWSACFGRRLSWRVSKKNLAGVFDWRLVMPQTALTLLSIAALVYGLVKIPTIDSTGPVSGMVLAGWDAMMNGSREGVFPAGSMDEVLKSGYSWDLLLISSYWVIYNASRSCYWLIDTYRRTKNTHGHYRFRIPLLMQDTAGKMHEMDWISEVSFRSRMSREGLNVGDRVTLLLWLPAGALKARAVITKKDECGVEADFEWDSAADRDRLCDALFSVDWHSEIHEREGYFPTLLEQFFMKLRFKSRPRLLKWKPGLMQCEGESRQSLAFVGGSDGKGFTQLLGFGESLEGKRARITMHDGQVTEYLVGEALGMQGWCKVGLDGCVRWKSSIAAISSQM